MFLLCSHQFGCKKNREQRLVKQTSFGFKRYSLLYFIFAFSFFPFLFCKTSGSSKWHPFDVHGVHATNILMISITLHQALHLLRCNIDENFFLFIRDSAILFFVCFFFFFHCSNVLQQHSVSYLFFCSFMTAIKKLSFNFFSLWKWCTDRNIK